MNFNDPPTPFNDDYPFILPTAPPAPSRFKWVWESRRPFPRLIIRCINQTFGGYRLESARWDRIIDPKKPTRWLYKIEVVWGLEPPEIIAIDGATGVRKSFKLYSPMSWADAFRWWLLSFWVEEKPVD